jgi:hypothetical protein
MMDGFEPHFYRPIKKFAQESCQWSHVGFAGLWNYLNPQHYNLQPLLFDVNYEPKPGIDSWDDQCGAGDGLLLPITARIFPPNFLRLLTLCSLSLRFRFEIHRKRCDTRIQIKTPCSV